MFGRRSQSYFVKTSILALGLATSLFVSAKDDTEPSCITGGAVPMKVKAGATSFQDQEIMIVEGVSGPEVRIGKTVLFLNPKSKDTGESSPSSTPSRNNEWCIVDPDLAKRRNAKPQEPDCSPFGKGFDDRGISKENIQIKNEKGSVIAELYAKKVKDSAGKEMISLVFSSKGGQEIKNKNKIELSGHVQGQGQKINSKLRLESKNFNSDKVNGAVEAEVSGSASEGSSDANDPRADYKMANCTSGPQGKGQITKSKTAKKKKSKDDGSTAPDISGSRITLRGSEEPLVSQYKKVEDEDKKPQEALADRTGRGGVE